MKETERDCAHCRNLIPFMRADGTWGASCSKWDCDFEKRMPDGIWQGNNCPYCKATSHIQTNYCSECGARLKKEGKT